MQSYWAGYEYGYFSGWVGEFWYQENFAPWQRVPYAYTAPVTSDITLTN